MVERLGYMVQCHVKSLRRTACLTTRHVPDVAVSSCGVWRNKCFGIPIRYPYGPFDSASPQRDNSVGRDTVSRPEASPI